MKRALFLCEHSGKTARPWVDAGYECLCIDMQNTNGKDGGYWWMHGDVTEPAVLDYYAVELQWDFACAMPPCTDLAGSGARWFKDKGLQAFIDSLTVVRACEAVMERAGCPYFIENPVGRLSSWRKPDHIFDPFEYGGYEGGENDGYTKRTCLWTGGGFVMPERKPIPLASDHDRIHKCPPGPERANIRSQTPIGFARAVFEANNQRTARREVVR